MRIEFSDGTKIENAELDPRAHIWRKALALGLHPERIPEQENAMLFPLTDDFCAVDKFAANLYRTEECLDQQGGSLSQWVDGGKLAGHVVYLR